MSTNRGKESKSNDYYNNLKLSAHLFRRTRDLYRHIEGRLYSKIEGFIEKKLKILVLFNFWVHIRANRCEQKKFDYYNNNSK